MVLNTAPGVNRHLGAEPDNSTALVAASRAKEAAMASRLGRCQPLEPGGTASGLRQAHGLATESQPLAGGGGSARVHFERTRSERAARAGASQLAYVVSQGYGRVPTTFVHTSADTLLPTTELQSPRRAAPRCHLLSFSAPCSPAASAPRSLLYSRATAAAGSPACQPHPCQANAVPAVDLLDRLALLRRVGPTTQPAPRGFPLQHHAAAVQYTAAPAAVPAATRASTGYCHWALGAGGLAESSPRPIAAVPAPGWRYHGECQASTACEPQEAGCQTEVATLPGPQRDQVVVVVTGQPSPPSSPGWEESGEEAAQPRPRPAFRPAGQLRHKAGRPKSAPPPQRRTLRAAAGLRECGCPRPAPGLAEQQRAARRAAQEEAAREEVAVIVTSPRPGARPASARISTTGRGVTAISFDNVAAVATSEEQAPCAAPGAETEAEEGAAICVVSSLRRPHADRDLVLVASPRAGGRGGCCGGSGTDLVLVSVDHCTGPAVTGSYPRSLSPGRSRPASPGAAAQQRVPAPAVAAAGVQTEAAQEPAPTTLSLTIPAGAQGPGFVVAARVGSPGGQAPAPGAGGVAGLGASPLQASGRHAAELAALTGEIQRRETCFKGMLGELERITEKCSDLAASIAGTAGRVRARSPGAKRVIAATCTSPHPSPGYDTYTYPAQLAAAATIKACHGSGGAGCSRDCGAAQELPAQGTRARTSSDSTVDAVEVTAVSTADRRGRGSGSAGSPGTVASSGTAGKSGEEWSWERLMEFERTIREQHRKLVEQGLLPADLS